MDLSSDPKKHRFVPTSFDPGDTALSGFPRPLSWRWDGLATALQAAGAKRILVRLPLFWQVQVQLNAVCRESGAGFFPNEPENIPVGAEAIRSLEADMVVSEAEDAFAFCSALAERNVTVPKTWFLIHRADALAWDIPALLAEAQIFEEVHRYPGVPVLTQCEALSQERGAFHVPPDAEAEEIVSSYGLRERDERCTCGEAIVEKAI